jgi:hypothetical protein
LTRCENVIGNDFEILNEDRRYSFESTVLLNHYFNKVELKKRSRSM